MIANINKKIDDQDSKRREEKMDNGAQSQRDNGVGARNSVQPA
jgi:hypothetical protein